MERRLKERLIGAAVLVMLAVIVIPMILDDSARTETQITKSNIPPRPAGGFTSRVVPLPGNDFAKRPVSPPAGAATGSEAAGGKPPSPQPESAAASPAPTSAGEPSGKSPTTASPAGSSGGESEKVGVTAWVVQLGSFSSESNANSLNEKLRKAGYSAFVERVTQNGEAVFRVRVGPELLRSQAQELQKKLKTAMGIDSIVLQYP